MTRLVRQLGLWSSVGVVIGITIGSGIFRTPAGIASRVPDPAAMIGIWILGGVITLCGALSVAELAAALPETGGFYVYLRAGWGRLAAFLFGWSQLVLIRGAALGGIASVFGEYFLRSIGIDPSQHAALSDYVSAGAIAVAAAINIVGVKPAALLVGLSTMTKFGALALLVLASFLMGGTHGATSSHFFEAGGPVQPGLFGLALVSVLWAYDGLTDLAYASGEVKDPQRNLPRALLLGTTAIIVIYVLANLAYLYVSPIRELSASPLIAADTMLKLFGPLGVSLVSVIVMISTFGSLNGTMLTGPRIFFAMADDRMLFPAVARVHRTFQTPAVAIGLSAILSMTLVLVQTFEQLADTFVIAIWPFYALGVAAIFRLRRTSPDLSRAYRVVGYPVVPCVFVVAAVYLLLNALLTDPARTLLVFAAILSGVPVYYAAFRRG